MKRVLTYAIMGILVGFLGRSAWAEEKPPLGVKEFPWASDNAVLSGKHGKIPPPFAVSYVPLPGAIETEQDSTGETAWGEEIISARDIAGQLGHRGAWVLWTGYQKRARHTTVLLQAVDEYGAAVGETKELYTIRGLVEHVRFQMLPHMAWLLLQVKTQANLTLWAIPFKDGVTPFGKPIKLQTAETKRNQYNRLEALTLSNERLLVSATTGSSYEVFLLEPSLASPDKSVYTYRSLGKRSLPGNIEDLDNLFEIEGTVVAEGMYTEKGSKSTDMLSQAIIAPLQKEAKRFSYTFPTCDGALNRFWSGNAWVSICQTATELRSDALKQACPVHSKEKTEDAETMFCWLVDVQSEDASLVSQKPNGATQRIQTPLLSYEEHCKNGHPVLDISYPGTNNNRVSLRVASSKQVGEQTRMSVGIHNVWTGKALLGFGHGEDQARVSRRRCLPDGTLEPPPWQE